MAHPPRGTSVWQAMQACKQPTVTWWEKSECPATLYGQNGTAEMKAGRSAWRKGMFTPCVRYAAWEAVGSIEEMRATAVREVTGSWLRRRERHGRDNGGGGCETRLATMFRIERGTRNPTRLHVHEMYHAKCVQARCPTVLSRKPGRCWWW